MNPYTLTALSAVPALDSRGTPTVSCRARLAGGGVGEAVVPSGASTGRHEVTELRDGGARFGGRGVDRAVAVVADEIRPAVAGMDARDQQPLDATLLELDGTPTLSRLGGNAILAVSIAVALAAAAQDGAPPYRWFGQGARPLLPLPMVNIFSGGAHASSGLDVQDLLAVPVGAAEFAQGLEWVWEVRHAVAADLAERGLPAALVADEGGFGVPMAGTRPALATLTAGIERVGLRPGTDVSIAVDVAATQLLGAGGYRFDGEGITRSADELLAEIAGWCADFPVISVEDPLAEDDWAGFSAACSTLVDQQVLGDDLLVTDVSRVRRAIDERAASAVLVKPNQCGTLSASGTVVELARRHGWGTVLSARSGDTEDSWLADLAVGWRTGQIKVGSLTRAERTAKWNRLLRIADELGGVADYSGGSAVVTAGSVRR